MNIRKGIMLALEEGEVVDSIAEVEPAIQTEVEQGTADVVSNATAIEEMLDAVDSAADDAGALGSVQELMVDSVEQGEGLPPAAAEIAEIAVEAICARLGIKKQRTLPSLESFTTNRLSSTKVAIEGMMDKIRTVWEAIKKAFASLAIKIKDFIKSFFENTKKVKELSDSVLKQADLKANSKQIEKTIDIGGAAKLLHNEGKINVAAFGEIFLNHSALTHNAVKSFDIIAKTVDLADGLLKDPSGSAFLQGAGIKAIEELAKSSSVGINSKKTEDGAITTTRLGPFISSQYIVMTLDTSNVTIKIALEKSEKEPESTTINALNIDNVKSMCKEVNDLMAVTDTYKSIQPKVDAIGKAFVNVADAAITLADKISDASENNAEIKKAIEKARSFVVELNNITTKYTVVIPSMNIRLSKAVLNVANIALKNYALEADK